MFKPLCFEVSNGENYSVHSKGKPTAVVPPISRSAVCLENRSETLRGSLPSSPDSLPSPGDCSVVDFFLDENIRNVLREFFCPSHSNTRNQNVLQTMRRVVNDLLTKHQFAYKGMISKLNSEEKAIDVHVIHRVAKELFNDGVTNWGRIASLLAFGVLICQHEEKNGRGHTASLVGEEISSYLLSDQREWLIKNKAWDGFMDFFHVADPESTVRTALMAFVTVAGIGAGIAYLTR